MIDDKALYPISAGVYLFTTLDNGRGVGRVIDAVSQIAANPKRVSVSLLKTGYTSQVIGTSKHFSLTILARDAPISLVKAFGYQSSKTADKFAGYEVSHDEAGVPWVKLGAVAQISCDVFGILDMGSHILVLGEVVEAQVLRETEPMTYAYYRKARVLFDAIQAEDNPSVPAAGSASGKEQAPSGYVAPKQAAENEEQAAEASKSSGKIGWRCTICQYVVEQDELPDDFTCPICGVGKDMFEKIEL